MSLKDGVTIKIAGKERLIRLGTNACVRFEEVAKKSLFDVLAGDVKVTDIRALLWAGLLHEDKSLSLDDVGDLIDNTEDGVMGILDVLTKAAEEAMPLPDEQGEDNIPFPETKNPSKT